MKKILTTTLTLAFLLTMVPNSFAALEKVETIKPTKIVTSSKSYDSSNKSIFDNKESTLFKFSQNDSSSAIKVEIPLSKIQNFTYKPQCASTTSFISTCEMITKVELYFKGKKRKTLKDVNLGWKYDKTSYSLDRAVAADKIIFYFTENTKNRQIAERKNKDFGIKDLKITGVKSKTYSKKKKTSTKTKKSTTKKTFVESEAKTNSEILKLIAELRKEIEALRSEVKAIKN